MHPLPHPKPLDHPRQRLAIDQLRPQPGGSNGVDRCQHPPAPRLIAVLRKSDRQVESEREQSDQPRGRRGDGRQIVAPQRLTVMCRPSDAIANLSDKQPRQK